MTRRRQRCLRTIRLINRYTQPLPTLDEVLWWIL